MAEEPGAVLGSGLSSALDGIQSLGGGASLQVVIGLGLAGAIAMAALQLLKEVTPLRETYQRKWFEQRFETAFRDMPSAIRAVIPADHPTSAGQAIRELVNLLTGGDAKAMFSLEPEDLGRRIQDLRGILVDYPTRTTSLYLALACNGGKDDVIDLLCGKISEGAYIDTRDRVARSIGATIDGMTISLCFRWRFWMQFTAIALTTMVVIGSVWSDSNSFAMGILAAPLGIVGGYFAPVMRDVVSAIEGLRKRT